MSKMWQVYIKSDDGKFEKWEGMYSITFNEAGLEGCSFWTSDGTDEGMYDGNAIALFRDLDLSQPIPEVVRCVVCGVATDELCEGDILLSHNDGRAYPIGYDKGCCAWVVEGWQDYMDSDLLNNYLNISASDGVLARVVGHALINRIDDNGEVRPR